MRAEATKKRRAFSTSPRLQVNIKQSSSLLSVSLPFRSQATVFMSGKANQNRRFYAAVIVYRCSRVFGLKF
ncbi:hypothetical protein LWI28_023500 [Acer negundo]|uniref:Uncharacterized protein n=1 Tax=Acer negundo TaxID=4023 RepID=A0AAD5P088_ACENE|nr:hypothetical protein LWI28_023500 [Acer negundo]